MDTYENYTDGIYELIKDKILVGYNCHNYDDYILTALINGQTNKKIKSINDAIIAGRRPSMHINSAIRSLDCFKQIDPSQPSLKKIEANLGRSIVESKIPFSYDNSFSPSQIEEVIKYCSYDIDSIIEVFKLRKYNYFDVKDLLIREAGLTDSARRYNTTTVATEILTDRNIDQFNYIYLGKKHNKILELVPQKAKVLWDSYESLDKKKVATIEKFNCKIEFSFGGLHGVNYSEQKKFKHVKALDVTSLYPNIILKLGILGSNSDKYKSILEKRVSVKHTHKQLSQALKLVINSCYGLLKNKFSKLYNPLGALSVCIFGQIALYDLCQRLYWNGCKLININTDGVMFTGPDYYCDIIAKEWQKDWGLQLEFEYYKTFIQKDVNNYIAVKPDGSIKVKGSDVGRYNEPSYFKNNSKRIIDICVVENLINGVDPAITIANNLDKPELFQIILQAGRTFRGVVDENVLAYQKVNRVFAVKEGVKLYKQRPDGTKIHFPDAPNNMLVFNENLSKFNLRNKIDTDFYVKLAQKVLKRWA
jgi:hypothetical protein